MNMFWGCFTQLSIC